MLEFRIDSDTVSCEDLFLVQNNSLLVINKVNFYNFVGLFYDISEKDSRVSITLGNKKLDNKNICLINLIDIASIYDQLKFKKGSLLYEYIVDEINQSIKDKVEEITEYLDDLFYRNIKRSLFEYDVNFAIDIQKLFLTFSNLNLEISLPEYIKKIDKLLNHLIERNPKKTFIIFKDYDYFHIDFISQENVYVFEINSPKENNIIIVDEVKNFDFEKTISYLKLMWPVEIEKQKLNSVLKNYINLYLKNNITKTNDSEIFITSYFLNKLYNLDYKIEIDPDTVYKSDAVKEFVQTLKK